MKTWEGFISFWLHWIFKNSFWLLNDKNTLIFMIIMSSVVWNKNSKFHLKFYLLPQKIAIVIRAKKTVSFLAVRDLVPLFFNSLRALAPPVLKRGMEKRQWLVSSRGADSLFLMLIASFGELWHGGFLTCTIIFLCETLLINCSAHPFH